MTETIKKGLNTCINNTKILQEGIEKSRSRDHSSFVSNKDVEYNSILDQILSNQKLTMIALMDILDNGVQAQKSGLETGKFGPG